MNETAGYAQAPTEVDVVVVGAGQAGLSSAYHLARVGIGHVVLDHAPRPGGAWQFRWPSLTYGKVHGMHALPGMELTGADPLRPSSEVIGAYFAAYEDASTCAYAAPWTSRRCAGALRAGSWWSPRRAPGRRGL